MQLLKIYQIYYKPEQVGVLDYTPYDNSGKCTVYFENSVISELIGTGAHKEAEYFGVVSHNIRQKVNTCERGPRQWIAIFDAVSFQRKVQTGQPDVMGFIQYRPHDPVNYWNGIHPRLVEFFEFVWLYITGRTKPVGNLNHVFYSNSFVAKSDIYERYVKELLNPAMEVMNGMPELYEDSGYPVPLPIDLQERFGVKAYPYHSFVAERLFSYWAHLNKLKCLYY